MPELPEVETVKRGLDRLIIGKQVSDVSYDWPKSFPNDENEVSTSLLGAKIVAITRRGKALTIKLNTSYSLVIHLKMTGQLVYVGDSRFGAGHPSDSLINSLPDKSTRVVLTFTDSTRLYFNDQRKFGWVRLLPSDQVQEMSFMKKLGPEPLQDEFTPEVFLERVKRRKNSSIKAAILDQTVLAGVGNIYADEALFSSRIHPSSKVIDIPDKKLIQLHAAIQAVLELSIEKGGSTNRNYVNAEGQKGSYMEFAQIFRRDGQSCIVDGTTIQKTRVAGRGTHFCPTCQKLYK